MHRIDISYWGYSVSLLRLLIDLEHYNVTCVITQNGKYSDGFAEICAEKNIPMFNVDNKEDLLRVCDSEQFSNVLVYCFGIIIPKELYLKKTIINIHPGSLKTNRGAHSLLWSILIPELGAELSAYRICCPEVDSGELIVSVKEKCEDDEKPLELLAKLEKNLPYITEKIYEYFAKKNVTTCLVKGGIYRERVSPEHYTLNVGNDTKSLMKRKINSQSLYAGAIFVEKGREIRITGYIDKGTELVLTAEDGSKRVIAFDNEECEN